VIIKIVTLIAILTYLLLGGPLVVLGNTTEEKVTNNVTNSEINTVSNIYTERIIKRDCIRHLSKLWYISYRCRVIKGKYYGNRKRGVSRRGY